MATRNRVNWGYQFYRFGGNKPALLLGGFALFLALVTAIGAFTLEDSPVCTPPYAGAGQPNAAGQVIAGQVVEREEKLSGCKALALRVQGHSASKLVPGQQAFDATAANPVVETVLVLQNLPARYTGLPVGTKLMALYDAGSETPLAFSFPTGPQSGTGLDIGSDTRTDYSNLRLMLYIVTGVLLLVGVTLLLVIRFYPVRSNAFAPPPPTTAPRPRRPRRPKADPITGEPLPSDEDLPQA